VRTTLREIPFVHRRFFFSKYPKSEYLRLLSRQRLNLRLRFDASLGNLAREVLQSAVDCHVTVMMCFLLQAEAREDICAMVQWFNFFRYMSKNEAFRQST
jgi:hypothetical protein